MALRQYPTRCKKIGEIKCLFLRCYKNGQKPFINIGPSIGPMICMIVFATFLLSYLLAFIATSKSPAWVNYLMYFSTFLNLFLYLKTLLGDPGIDPCILEHYRNFEFD